MVLVSLGSGNEAQGSRFRVSYRALQGCTGFRV